MVIGIYISLALLLDSVSLYAWSLKIKEKNTKKEKKASLVVEG